MGDYTVKRIGEMEAIFGGAFKRARAELGVESFGIQVIDLPPSHDGYIEHDHADSGEEEVFAVMRGAGEIELDGERHPLDVDHLVRVGPAVKRKIWPGPEGMRVLALGGYPGRVFEPRQMSMLGEPDPFSR